MKFFKPSLRRSGPWVAVLLAMLLVATACSDTAVDAPGGSSDVSAPLTEEGLKSATYELEELGAIQLSDGEYKHQWGEGATQADLVGLEAAAMGDLNGDGLDDAAVVLWWQSGGTGTYLYLVAVLNEDGPPRQVGIERLGDRVRVEALSIGAGEILLTTLTHDPDDPLCCPTQTVRDSYTLQQGALAKTASDLIGGAVESQIPAELLGIVWRWQGFIDVAGSGSITVEDTNQYTLEFLPDGTYQVVADCNRSGGRYTLEGGQLILEPGPTTLAECGPDSLYSQYLTHLGDVVTFVIQDGELTLNLKLDAGDMVFTGPGSGALPADIVDVEWQWSELFETSPAAQSIVPNPERYTLVFRSDGSLQIRADCNVVGGSAALEGDGLTITLGPSTMAFCGEGSLDQPYLELLGKVGGYAVENGRLVLHLSEDAGRMTFDVVGATGADDASSDITGVTWRWEHTTTPIGVIKSADAPDKYTIKLLPDGQFQFSADCNTGSGTYTLQGGQLGFEIGPMTRAACPPESLSDEFIEELQAAAIYFVEGGELYIDLIYDSGTMRFSRGE